MSEMENILEGDAGVAAVLGLIIVNQGGEVRIPAEAVEQGLPANSGVRVDYDAQTDELVIAVVAADNEEA